MRLLSLVYVLIIVGTEALAQTSATTKADEDATHALLDCLRRESAQAWTQNIQPDKIDVFLSEKCQILKSLNLFTAKQNFLEQGIKSEIEADRLADATVKFAFEYALRYYSDEWSRKRAKQ